MPPGNNMDAKDYLFSFRMGEEEGFTHVFNKFFAPLSYYAQRFVNDREMADDIVQEAFLRLWKKRDSLTGINSLKSYLYRSVYNICVTDYHQAKKIKSRLKEMPVTDFTRETQYDHIVRAELMNEIFRLLETLPSGFVEVIRLYYIEGKGTREIAELLDLPLYTVKFRRLRGLQRIRQMLPGYFTVLFLCLFVFDFS